MGEAGRKVVLVSSEGRDTTGHLDLASLQKPIFVTRFLESRGLVKRGRGGYGGVRCGGPVWEGEPDVGSCVYVCVWG